MIESVDEIRNFYQLTFAAQSSYPLQQAEYSVKPNKQMELLVLFIIGLLIAILVLPFVALAKANSAKRGVDNLATRLSSLENEVHSLRRHTTPAPEPEAAVAVAVPPPIPIITPPLIVQEKKSVPPPIPKRFVEGTGPQITAHARPPINWEQFMGAKLFAWIGGLALFLGVAFFVKYSFEHKLISPELRVAIGFVVGASLVIGGLLLKRKENAVTAQTLCATGTLVLYAVTFACRAYYYFAFFGLIPTFLLMTLITAMALLLDIGLLALAQRQRWNGLAILGAVGTALMQFAWITTFFVPEKYFVGNKVLIAMTVFAGFQALFLAATVWAKRSSKIDRQLLASAFAMAAVAMCAAFYFLSFQAIAQRPALLFGYVFVVDLALLALTILETRAIIAQLLAGCAAFVLLSIWTGNYLTNTNLFIALGFYFVFALFHTATPIALQRLRKIDIPSWSQVFPAFALLLVLIPVFQLTELSLAVWSFVLIVDLVAIVLALTTATLLPVIGVLVLTFVAVGAWFWRIPSELTGLPTALFILAGFAIFFVVASGWAARR